MKNNIQNRGITLIALVVTIVVLLILAGITIQLLINDGGIFSQANRAKEQTEIAVLKDRIENIRISWIVDKTLDPSLKIDDLWNRFIAGDIIATTEDVEGPEKDENGNDVYTLNTKDGYTVEIIVNETGLPEIGDIVKGALPPIIRRIEASSTASHIKAKAIVSRLKNGSVEYWCKVSTENDSEYKKMNFISNEEEAEIDLTPVEGATYVIKAVAQNEAGKHESTAEITIGLKVKGLTIDKTQETLVPSETLQLIPTITPDNAENKKLTWTSSNPEVATVDENGVITAVTNGSAVIIVTTTDGSNLSATCNITVEIPVESVALNITSTQIKPNGTITLVATVMPENATNKNVTWKSSDTSIATVNSSGVVTGKVEGTATITVTSVDDTIKTASCTVKVSEEDNWEEIAKWAGQIAKDSSINSNSEFATVNLTGGGTKKVTVGDLFTVKYNGEKYTVRLLGFKHDTLAENTSYGNIGTPAGMSFEFTEILEKNQRMHSADDNLVGWKGCEMRIYLNGSSNTTKGGLVTALSNKGYIKKVTKPYLLGYSATTASKDCSDWLWLLSCSEIWDKGRTSEAIYGYAKAKEGERYKFYSIKNPDGSTDDVNANLRKKTKEGSAQGWWLRSPTQGSHEGFCTASGAGQSSNTFASWKNSGISPGFSI